MRPPSGTIHRETWDDFAVRRASKESHAESAESAENFEPFLC